MSFNFLSVLADICLNQMVKLMFRIIVMTIYDAFEIRYRYIPVTDKKIA